MTDETMKRPLVVTSGTGAGGVSPAVSMLPETFTRQTEELSRAVADVVTASAAQGQDAAQAIGLKLEGVARSLDVYYAQTASQAQTLNQVLLETARTNIENAMHMLQDLSGAASPKEAIQIQSQYYWNQMQIFTDQLRHLNAAFEPFFRPAKAIP